MAYDAYLWFTGGKPPVLGETTDAEMKAKNAMEVMSFSFGVHNQVTIGSGTGGGGAGKADFSGFNFMKVADKSTAALFANMCAGDHFDQVDLAMRKSAGAGKASEVFATFSFKFCMLESISWSGGSGNEVCSEAVSFQYGAIKYEYFGQDAKGKLNKLADASWSRVLNKGIHEVA